MIRSAGVARAHVHAAMRHHRLVSGLSGSGKSVALHMLEDLGFYCIDNIPAALLQAVHLAHGAQPASRTYERTAVGLDARNTPAEIASVPQPDRRAASAAASTAKCCSCAPSDEELLRRFAETRRKHPMSRDERRPARGHAHGARAARADRSMPPTWSSTPRAWACTSCASSSTSASSSAAPGGCRSLFESFGFKHGIPGDADFVFDARSLPNPYWEPALRELTGRDPDVVRFLEAQDAIGQADRRHRRASSSARIPEYHATQSRLSHRRDRLHRRAASLRVHRRASRREHFVRAAQLSATASTARHPGRRCNSRAAADQSLRALFNILCGSAATLARRRTASAVHSPA